MKKRFSYSCSQSNSGTIVNCRQMFLDLLLSSLTLDLTLRLFFVNLLEICQLRLDFDNFDIVETAAGVCTDSLTISGPTGRNPMDLCGTLKGMHGE